MQTLSCIALIIYQYQICMFLLSMTFYGDSDLQPALHQLCVMG